ncbi:cysteine--tRNA ligase [Oscillatoria amoena NRMC-F 0135]|nr:cysteine--tRNA ligase [Oscillatoria laete-virens]MDL5046247.1 cysteine--tRNA ligase [Oscillatoria amoena NRMC-F 0135]MDL5053928.1 cysteine--tRNA ligase [Oscillatoria laete-virens NRMC-F 0139]
MSVRLFDTLSRKVLPLEKSNGEEFRYYCCGPTVYGPAHIGNFRTFLIQDVLRRVLEVSGLNVKHVRNLTDVDDKTIHHAQAQGKTLEEFTAQWTEIFHRDCGELNILPPHIEPSAVKTIPEQIVMIERLMTQGFAYAGQDGSVYFRIGAFKTYGRLSHLQQREIQTGASAFGAGDADEYTKDNASDFALWKSRKPEDGPNAWAAPWGQGRPGWHIECSAMCKHYLGDTIDLHSGGEDLVFPHHENEIAQSEAANGAEFCRHWFHISHLMVDGAKMSKSLGNLYTLEDIKKRGFTANEMRYVLISGFYRQPLNFTFDSMHAARSALGKLRRTADHVAQMAEEDLRLVMSFRPQKQFVYADEFVDFWSALQDDLNIPKALGGLFTGLKKVEEELKAGTLSRDRAKLVLLDLGQILYALGVKLPDSLEQTHADKSIPDDIAALAQSRWEAKQSKDWAKADEIRQELDTRGWMIKDRKDGFDILPK